MRRQAQRLVCRKGLIALGIVLLVVILPVGFGHSRNGTTAVADSAGDLVLYGRGQADAPVRSDPIIQAWSRTPDLPRNGGADASVQSFTTYPRPMPYAVSSVAYEKRQLVEEIERRLAIMRGGATTLDSGRLASVPQQMQSMSQSPALSSSWGLDGDAPLQMFQSVEPPRPMNPLAAPETVAPPAAEAERVQVGRRVTESKESPRAGPDPNLTSNPAAQAAFSHYYKEAATFLHQRQYSRAANSFTLALAYRPNDANAYLGKGQALFAAGEYPDSGTTLARAVELDPKSALRKVDLVTMAGGPDGFIDRFNELARRAEDSPLPSRHFLLAYVYYQMDQLEQAKRAIEAARSGSFSPTAVEALRAAIER
jgi:TolA-binding protein